MNENFATFTFVAPSMTFSQVLATVIKILM